MANDLISKIGNKSIDKHNQINRTYDIREYPNKIKGHFETLRMISNHPIDFEKKRLKTALACASVYARENGIVLSGEELIEPYVFGEIPYACPDTSHLNPESRIKFAIALAEYFPGSRFENCFESKTSPTCIEHRAVSTDYHGFFGRAYAELINGTLGRLSDDDLEKLKGIADGSLEKVSCSGNEFSSDKVFYLEPIFLSWLVTSKLNPDFVVGQNVCQDLYSQICEYQRNSDEHNHHKIRMFAEKNMLSALYRKWELNKKRLIKS